MHEFPCKQDETLLTTGDALPLTDSSHTGLLVYPQRTYTFVLQLPEQFSSAIKPGPATLVNGIQCPFGDNVPLHLVVGSKTTTSNINDGSLGGTPQLFKIP